ncbi:MAG TPA: sugar phosphate nucleotidyltransferase [Stellaceae bacterium]|jgi:NDP-sugar pyrophosphorylase family protein|nr:sugar phosphate nucleotidyltransferase [Stellaceae bacterium]
MDKHEHSDSGLLVADPVVRHATSVTQAVIMAGGKGTRLYPYSALFPKPLMPLGDMPVLELLLRRMKKAGITDVILAINHLGNLIKTFFGDGSQLGLKIRYSNEDQPLGTAGALGNMLGDLDSTFLVSNGDLLTTMDLEAMAQQHIATDCDASIGIFQRENKIDFGLVEFDAENRLCAYREKPTNTYYVSMGVYVLRRDAVRPHIVPREYLDMPALLLKMRAARADIRCYYDDCMWLDIGRPDDFALAQTMFERNRDLFLGE